MNLDFLDFEQPIAELLAKIEELRYVSVDNKININQEIARLEDKSRELTKAIFAKLTAMQVVKLARHPQRPHTLDYIERIFTDFDELFGDRHFAKGKAIIGGIARLNNQAVMIIGHQKGRTTKENLECNFGMPNPEDYRKALRLMKLAEKFQLPIFTFIDTPGAYPGIGAEERNQSEAIARNLFVLAKLRTPIICTVIGEGGSGGALALGVGDKVIMLQYSIYATISPEGCASILWRSQEMINEAAKALHLTADKLFKLKLINQIVTEPLGGAHRDYDLMAKNLKLVLINSMNQLCKLPLGKLTYNRYEKIMNFGR
ncbi:MAG: acetyl-CoA carboxylase carboxyltransferase subunit alpha [Coxiellaceae bacterium]|jgi:acetyl-CoA carboxylase carboxyl transferase subunit alpha|nr:acetyl-CoA carboxylase carboxyltransferase subunit alpha [Coxiellaceae bacterium]